MGYKLLKEVYDIKHIVQVCNEERYGGKCICIGSPYIHDIIVLSMDGDILRDDNDTSNEELVRYQKEFKADAEKLKRIVLVEDVFDIDKNKTVYIYSGGKIRRELCQEYGWPNTTNKGELMYENTSFKNYADALKYAKYCTEIDHYRWSDRRSSMQDAWERMWKAQRFMLLMFWDWFYVRTYLVIRKLFEK